MYNIALIGCGYMGHTHLIDICGKKKIENLEILFNVIVGK